MPFRRTPIAAPVRAGLSAGSREGHDVHVPGRPLDGERPTRDLPTHGGPLELVVVAAADCPDGAAGGIGHGSD